MENQMTRCPEDGCKEIKDVNEKIDGLEDHVYGNKGKGGVFGEDGLKDKLSDKLDTGNLRSWFFAFSGTIVIFIMFVAVMWANTRELTKEVPACKTNIEDTTQKTNKLITDVEVLKTEKKQIQDDVKEIKGSVNKILDILQDQQMGLKK
jgi:uncharacterized coiled-coil DUF342 family protein